MASTSTVHWLLIVFGAGLFAGNVLGRKLADRSRDASLRAFLGTVSALLDAPSGNPQNNVGVVQTEMAR